MNTITLTKNKKNHVIVISTTHYILHYTFLYHILKFYVYNPLQDDTKYMEHYDPSEIISTPMDTYNLQMVSISSTFYILLYTILICRYSSTTLQQQSKNNSIVIYVLMTYLTYTILFYIGCILAGASISLH